MVDDLRGSGVGLEDLERGRPAHLGELLDHRQGLRERRAGPAVALRQRDAEEAEVSQGGSPVGRHRGPVQIHPGGQGLEHLGRDLGRQLADLVVVGQGSHGTRLLCSRALPEERRPWTYYAYHDNQ
ncbi:hypothetical protein LUX73_44235 [Actinomadura madurae]|nr:hypothetical protein [Actinomadura madurae]MCQ0011014.1 hypothetical protein [Actinomadura madurae]